MVHYPNGTRERITGSAPNHINTKAAAEQAMRDHIERALHPERVPTRKETPTFKEWFKGRFWLEWVVGRKNKPTEVRSKNIIFDNHLEPRFGAMPLDEIDVGEIARFRAALVGAGLGEKRINNILVVLSKALRYANDCELITKVPKIGLFKVERPEFVAWDFEQYARLLATAKLEGEDWYTAVCLAGEAGLRVGEVKALRWREDVDMIAKTITVNQQTCNAETTTPKGRTRRTVPMTSALFEALKRMSVIREGFVVRNLDGSAKKDGDTDHAIARMCRRAGLPVRYWHTLRHAFGTHAALFGVNPWRLQAWLGHKRIDETMLYVHVAEAHVRELPEPIRAHLSEPDPDTRILKMLGARGKTAAKTAAGAISSVRESVA
ncbi:MAG: site-specific integrase [Deltaproteobacteria bacterium]|nr:site-specific integrase [Deltaproteobacteria bacterium]